MKAAEQGIAYNNPGDVVINLQLVNSCNFACGHCMYACKPLPANSEIWMSDEVILEVFQFIAPLVAIGHNVSLNLIGGEPTKDLVQFQRILNLVMAQDRQGISVEMTTNGWWLREWKTLCQFAAITGRHMDELNIRISNSIYHDPFRSPTERHIFAIASKRKSWEPYVNPLKQLLTYSFDYYESEPKCPHCNQALTQEKCQHCGEDISEDEYYEAADQSYNVNGSQDIPLLLKACENDQLYIDSKVTNDSKVSPVGRALKKGIGCQKVACWDGRMIFTIAPSGDLQGICCVGGHVPIGHIKQGARVIHDRAAKYISAVQDLSYNNPCSKCSLFAKQWIKDNVKAEEAKKDQPQTARNCRQELAYAEV